MLPFRPGFARLHELAGRHGNGPVPIIPAGLSYRQGRRWEVQLRFGRAILPAPTADRRDVIAQTEEAVRSLSQAPARANCYQEE
jgi:putative membrane protein